MDRLAHHVVQRSSANVSSSSDDVLNQILHMNMLLLREDNHEEWPFRARKVSYRLRSFLDAVSHSGVSPYMKLQTKRLLASGK
jgi:hypothetical protein